MSYKVIPINSFQREAKRLLKKYPSLRNEIESLYKQLELQPFEGTPLGHDCFKIRMSIQSKGRGKSREARVITHIHVFENIVYILSMYDKSEKSDISLKELERLIATI